MYKIEDKRMGILAMQIYFPKTYVNKADLEKFHGVSEDKYTHEVGQAQLSFNFPYEDINSMTLTAVNNLLRRKGAHPKEVGRVEIGTETLVDKSNSTKTVLMDLFKGDLNIEGITIINNCSGAINAFLNGMKWLTSASWDGRYCIVVASDLTCYEKGSSRAPRGAGAIAILLGPNAGITFETEREDSCKSQHDFYKSKIYSEYSIIQSKLSIECYLTALQSCYLSLSKKLQKINLEKQVDHFCFQIPYYQFAIKAFIKIMHIQYGKMDSEEISQLFLKKVHYRHCISQRLENIYKGSVFSSLMSFLIASPDVSNKRICLFSYGTGLSFKMLLLKVHKNILQKDHIKNICDRIENRLQIQPLRFDKVMSARKRSLGRQCGKIQVQEGTLGHFTFYLSEINAKFKRKYQLHLKSMELGKKTIAQSRVSRMATIQNALVKASQQSKFYKLSVQERRQIIKNKSTILINDTLLDNGGLTLKIANSMTQNVIGKVALPLSVVPQFVINNRQYMIPMCIEQPSVVAACSSIGKFMAPYSFHSSSTPDMMIGQVHLPNSETNEIHTIITKKKEFVQKINARCCMSMMERGGGVNDIKVRQLNGVNSKQYSVDIFVNVCDAMGANIVNTIAEQLKEMINSLGIRTGIAILTNYCIERKALSWFEIPVIKMAWKGHSGEVVVQKILQAYEFAKSDHFRAVTHNKGIMNGIDAVCMATGQDWRAVQSSAHCYASRSGKYLPLSHYETCTKNGLEYFRGNLEIPISVGVVGGAIRKNPLYRKTLQIMGNPTSQQLSEIIVSVGLAQNLAALRALATQGIQKGHMALHNRTKINTQVQYISEQQIRKQFSVVKESSTTDLANEMTLKPRL